MLEKEIKEEVSLYLWYEIDVGQFRFCVPQNIFGELGLEKLSF
jgi:hypothetical protein